MKRAPALFVSHGSPLFAVERGLLGAKLAEFGQHLDNLDAVVAVSPHWSTDSLQVGANAQPETIHDFGGFPAELYELQYPVAGSPAIAEQVGKALQDAGLAARLNPGQGLDHGVWVPMMHLRAKADIPVIPVSLPVNATPASALAVGQALSPLREQGVLVMGSGSLTHNLAEFRGSHQQQAASYVMEFTHWVRAAVLNHDIESLLHYRTMAPHAARAHPSEEHFLPLFVSLGAALQDDATEVLATEVRHGMLSMESYAWGH